MQLLMLLCMLLHEARETISAADLACAGGGRKNKETDDFKYMPYSTHIPVSALASASVACMGFHLTRYMRGRD